MILAVRVAVFASEGCHGDAAVDQINVTVANEAAWCPDAQLAPC